jgi:hypothetical protein
MSRVWPWRPVALWAVVITSFSTDTFSREHTSRIAVPLLRWLFPHASPDTIELLHVVVRECAHVFEYFVFGWLLFRAFRGNRQGWTVRWAARAIHFRRCFCDQRRNPSTVCTQQRGVGLGCAARHRRYGGGDFLLIPVDQTRAYHRRWNGESTGPIERAEEKARSQWRAGVR